MLFTTRKTIQKQHRPQTPKRMHEKDESLKYAIANINTKTQRTYSTAETQKYSGKEINFNVYCKVKMSTHWFQLQIPLA